MMVIGFGATALAQDGLNLSGIVGGTAIINDQVVAAGDSVGDLRVVTVAGDHVVLEGKAGKTLLRLKELDAKASKPAMARPSASGATPSMKPQAAPAAANPSQKVPEKASKHLDRSIENLKEADALLRSPVKYDALYVKAASYCDDAAREAQTALRLIYDEASRRPVTLHIAKVQQVRNAIIREKEELNTRVRTAIVNRQVFAGMTDQNVIASWGVPLSKTNVGPQERWAYKDPNGYQRNLNFSKGILVSF
jgi:hypothetical protein